MTKEKYISFSLLGATVFAIGIAGLSRGCRISELQKKIDELEARQKVTISQSATIDKPTVRLAVTGYDAEHRELELTYEAFDKGENAGLTGLVLEGSWFNEKPRILAGLPTKRQIEDWKEDDDYGKPILRMGDDIHIQVPDSPIGGYGKIEGRFRVIATDVDGNRVKSDYLRVEVTPKGVKDNAGFSADYIEAREGE